MKEKPTGTEKTKDKNVSEDLRCIWEEHLPNKERKACPYKSEQKAYRYAQPLIELPNSFPEAVCRYCQGQRKVIALEGIDYELSEINLALAVSFRWR